MSREWAGWFCNHGGHIVTDSEVPMTFRQVGGGLTVADCPEHAVPHN